MFSFVCFFGAGFGRFWDEVGGWMKGGVGDIIF